MKITMNQLREMIRQQLEERCQKGYKAHETRKTKKMFPSHDRVLMWVSPKCAIRTIGALLLSVCLIVSDDV